MKKPRHWKVMGLLGFEKDRTEGGKKGSGGKSPAGRGVVKQQGGCGK